MKTYIIALLLLCTAPMLYAQNTQGVESPKKHIISILGGVWERDESKAEGYVDPRFGPVGGLEYQYVLNDYISLRGKIFAGGIFDNDAYEIHRHFGISAGILVTPFGKRFTNLKIGISPMYILENVENQTAFPKNYYFMSWVGVEIPLRFYIFDKPKWQLGIGCDIQLGYNLNDPEYDKFGVFTVAPMIIYGIKF